MRQFIKVLGLCFSVAIFLVATQPARAAGWEQNWIIETQQLQRAAEAYGIYAVQKLKYAKPVHPDAKYGHHGGVQYKPTHLKPPHAKPIAGTKKKY